MRCEKCEKAEATTLVVDQPDYVHDRLAGWLMCEECFEADSLGWYEVLDATQIDTVDVLPAKAVPKRPAPRAEVVRAKAPEKPKAIVHGKRANDDLITRAYELHSGGMKLADVAREVMKVHPYKNVQSACASLRVNFKKRGWEVRGRQGAVAA